jgi:hypothetical protein
LQEQCPDPVVIFMPEIDKTTLGTMKLGIHHTIFQPGSEWSKLRQLYSEIFFISMGATATGMKFTQITSNNWQRVAGNFSGRMTREFAWKFWS